MGIIASKNTRTPMPPSQWVKLRQYKRLIGKASTFCTTLAPVVVKPETVSKIQSIKFGISPLIQKGSAPKRDTAIHANDTVRKPSRA